MRPYRVRITPKSAFGTPLKGDTLFGQICWAARNQYGVERLESLLEKYTAGLPFVVVSDAFPADHLPRPALPGHWFDEITGADRKAAKKRIWLPVEHYQSPVAGWLAHLRPARDVLGAAPEERPQPHNTLNRETGTTSKGEFAPYAMSQLWYGQKQIDRKRAIPEVLLDLYFVLDEERMKHDELQTLLGAIGKIGYGRDASIGLGKFEVKAFEPFDLPKHDDANAWLTLAPCAPQGLAWDETCCFYQPFTRFGRHGDAGAHSGNPFKTPVLLADTGAVLTPVQFEKRAFAGQGLGGDGSLSKAVPETVHQGYAPIAAIRLPEQGGRQ